MRWARRTIAALAAGLVLAGVAASPVAGEAPPVEGAGGPRLRVLLDEDPPFVIRDGERWSGWAIDLWTEIARQAGLDWDIVGEATPDAIVDALAAGGADVGLGDISVTQERAARIDFSHPFFHSRLRILASSDRRDRLAAALGSLATPTHARMLVAVIGLVAGMSALVYVLARRHDLANFPATRAEGIAEAVHVTFGALLKGTLERKLLPGAAGRVLTILWMILGTAVASYLTAAIAAALAVQHLSGSINGLDDLVRRPVAAVQGHQSVKWLARHDVSVIGQPNLDAAVESLLARRVDAVIHDEPGLAWWIARHPTTDVTLADQAFSNKDYAIALRRGSPLRGRINSALLALEEAGFLDELDRRWLGAARH